MFNRETRIAKKLAFKKLDLFLQRHKKIKDIDFKEDRGEFYVYVESE